MRNTSCPRCNQSPCECETPAPVVICTHKVQSRMCSSCQALHDSIHQSVKAPSHKPITVRVNKMEYKAYLEVTGNAFERGLFDAFEVAKGWLNSRTRRSRHA
jgi:hypothetical protein